MTPEEIRQFLLYSGVPDRYVEAGKADITDRIWQRVMPFLSGQSAYIVGPVGVGKTHLAAALTREWWLQRPSRRPRFAIASELLVELRNRISESKSCDSSLDGFSNTECLVLDDLGVERSTDWAVEMLTLIVDRRYRNNGLTLVTGNLPLDSLAAKLGDRTASRIAEMCRIIALDGPDRRRGQGRDRHHNARPGTSA